MGSSTDGLVRLRRALLSVSDTTGLADLARVLSEFHVELVATGHTGEHLKSHGIHARSADELTGIGAWFGGRIKTLHPGVLGGILAPRTPDGEKELKEHGLVPIDLVAVNFYPFEAHLRDAPAASDREEFIDIGGVTLARAAAKNHTHVVVSTSPAQYPALMTEIRSHGGATRAATREALARAAFQATAAYDRVITRALESEGGDVGDAFPGSVTFRRDPLKLRYGENPHQRATAYVVEEPAGLGFPSRLVEVLKGESLSFTNLLDLDTALSIVTEFPDPTAAVVKHATPCGVASGPTAAEALHVAIETDPVARYGCAIAVNRPMVAGDGAALHGVFVDLLAAPEFSPEAVEELSHRPKLKVVRVSPPDPKENLWLAQAALGRLLVQEADRRQLTPSDFRLVTPTPATPIEACALDFAWRVVRHAKSNAIVLAQGSKTVGIGSGQPTRVKAVELACEVAGERAKGAVLASDAFFPFADGVEVAGRAGVRAIIEPGGSIRDPEVIAAAEKFGISLYFTGWRVFRH